jgi:FkbM family methyltransferase
MKHLLVGTPFGRISQAVRQSVRLHRSMFGNPEAAGTAANDHIAEYLLVRLAKPGSTFIDVGSHIGSVIAEVLKNCQTVRIHAFEPVPQKARQLQQKWPCITVHCVAVGKASNKLQFYVDNNRPGYSSLEPPKNKNGCNVTEITVMVKPLDAIILAADVDVIKLDVEGYEFDAMQGAARLLDCCQPTVMFESVTGGSPEETDRLRDMWHWITKRNYSIFIPNRIAHDGTGLVLDSFIDAHVYPRRTTNYFAISDDRRSEIRDAARKLLKISAQSH